MNDFEKRIREQALNYKPQNPNNITISDMRAMQETLRKAKRMERYRTRIFERSFIKYDRRSRRSCVYLQKERNRKMYD